MHERITPSSPLWNVPFPGPWVLSQRYLPHALLCQALIVQEQMLFPEAANLLYKVGIYFYRRAQYQEAEPLYQQALAIYERVLGAEHPTTVRTLENYIVLLEKTKRQAEAAKLKERVKAIRAKKQR